MISDREREHSKHAPWDFLMQSAASDWDFDWWIVVEFSSSLYLWVYQQISPPVARNNPKIKHTDRPKIPMERPTSIVWDWCIDLIALTAHWRFWKVMNAHPSISIVRIVSHRSFSQWNRLPRLLPFTSRRIVQSSIAPYDWKSPRMFGSSKFFEIIPMNSFRSKFNKDQQPLDQESVFRVIEFYHFDSLRQLASFESDGDYPLRSVSYAAHSERLRLPCVSRRSQNNNLLIRLFAYLVEHWVERQGRTVRTCRVIPTRAYDEESVRKTSWSHQHQAHVCRDKSPVQRDSPMRVQRLSMVVLRIYSLVSFVHWLTSRHRWTRQERSLTSDDDHDHCRRTRKTNKNERTPRTKEEN